MLDKSTDWEIDVDLLFTITLTVLKSISVEVSWKIVHVREKQLKLHHHHISSMVRTLIKHKSLHQSINA